MNEFNWDSKGALSSARNVAKVALNICALDLKGKSQAEAPIKTGDLRSNCSVPPLTETDEGLSATVGYSLIYSHYQHEHTEFNHPLGGKAKFLSDPAQQNMSKYFKKIADMYFKGFLEGGK
jgi:hypothetical protein